MYAVIKTGGKQYRVEQGDVMSFERLAGEPGDPITFGDVLLVSNDDATQIGAPMLDGVSVSGTIVEQGRGKKLVVFKFRRRKDSKSKNGHRQYFTRVKIDSIAV
ncbi:MAG: large subunit ribosomal protein L21 [Myxococcota bacterium]|jgi:large subunit ribosomal protein L21